MPRSRPDPRPPPGLAEFVAEALAGETSHKIVLEEYRVQWRKAYKAGDARLVPTTGSVGDVIGIPRKTVSNHVRKMCEAGKMIGVGNRTERRFVPNETEFTSALPPAPEED